MVSLIIYLQVRFNLFLTIYCGMKEGENLYQDYFEYLFDSLQLQKPSTWQGGLNMYQQLMQIATKAQ